MRRIFFIAGEASGDLHGSALVAALLRRDPTLVIQGWGGDQMATAGCEVLKHYRELAFMGFVEVLRNLGTIRANFRLVKEQIQAFRPDAVVFVDYPGFNMRMLPWVKAQGITTIYYIAPQVWAWHRNRVKVLRQYADQTLVILPFEEAFFREHGVDAQFVGHPLVERIPSFRPAPDFHVRFSLDDVRPVIALLPGSRRQEVHNMLPAMLHIARAYPEFQWAVSAAPSLPDEVYASVLPEHGGVKLIRGATYDLLSHATTALVTSGTATLETALFRVPQVVLYKGNWLSYQIARRLVQVKYISLVNLLLDRPLVQELIQDDLTPTNLQIAFDRLRDTDIRAEIQTGYDTLLRILGEGKASELAAELVLRAESLKV
jgi:lipid-A-disaccharide synthase